jgi:hypothetical protein
VRGAAVDPNSDALIASIGLSTGLHPDFGAGLLDGAPIGIPYIVVAGSQAKVAVTFTAYGDESDPGPYPVPANAPVEGGSAASNTGDRHVLVIDRDNNRLYELDDSHLDGDGSWNAAGGAVFHLDSDAVRPTAQPGWTSAMPPACRSSPAWHASRKQPPGRAASFTPCASPCSIRAAPTCRRPRTSRRRTRARTCRRWACACA